MYKPRTSILVTVVTLSIAMIRMCHKILLLVFVCVKKNASQEALFFYCALISDQGYVKK